VTRMPARHVDDRERVTFDDAQHRPPLPSRTRRRAGCAHAGSR
jgi:hypothetical protein